HGRIDEPESWILSEQEYGKRYANSLKFGKFWGKFLDKFRIIIFLGYGLREKDVRRKFYNRDNLFFWIERILEQNEGDKEEKITHIVTNLKMNGINIYPIIYKDKNENSIFEVLDNIYQNAFGLTIQFTREE
ncbi:MAG: SIR2 family protein, partial [Candidatus Desulfofervidus auxilii]|nr:SIR2 family protein [Candidatus Desulfofervidus auxilii]